MEKRFYGREWVFKKLSQYLEQRKSGGTSRPFCPEGVIVLGGPGSGKTALCSELVRPGAIISSQSELSNRITATYFIQKFDASSCDPANFIISIANQLLDSCCLPDFKGQFADTRLSLDSSFCRKNPLECFQSAIIGPLLKVEEPPEPLIILIDSLHEAVSNSMHPPSPVTILDLVSVAAKSLPKWLLLVCTSRKVSQPVTQAVIGFKKLCLDDLRKSDIVRDVQHYILSRLDAEDSLKDQLDLETAEMLNQLHVKSAGCIGYLEIVLDGVKKGHIRMKEIQYIPCTLNGLFLWLCQRLFPLKKNFDEAKIVLELLLSARHALSLSQIKEMYSTRKRGISERAMLENINRACQLLRETQTAFVDTTNTPGSSSSKSSTIRVTQCSFVEWLVDIKHCTRKYLCSLEEGHGTIALHLWRKGSSLTPDEMMEFVYHLARSNLPPSHFTHLLLQSGAPVQDLVITAPATDDLATRTLMEAGADFVSLGESQTDEASKKTTQDSMDSSLASESSGGTRSEKDVMDEHAEFPDSEGMMPLHHRAAAGRFATVRRLLKSGVFCDPKDQGGDTPLCIAARAGHFRVVHALLEAGAEPNHQGSNGWTPLRSAAWGGHGETVSVLLMKSAQVDLPGSDGRSPLRGAAWGGHDDVIRLIVSAGANVDSADFEGRTALMAAAYMGHTSSVQILLDAHADPNKMDNDGRTALAIIALCGSDNSAHLDSAKILIEAGGDVSIDDSVGRTPLILAALSGNVEMCRLLLHYGSDVHACDCKQSSALLAAAACGNSDLIRILLDAGAVGDHVDSEGRTALSLAAAIGSSECVSLLMERELDELHRDHNGWIPLHHAALEGKAEACELLGARNPKTLDEKDHLGRTPLMLAAQEGHEITISVLLDMGASTSLTCVQGQTPLRFALLNNWKGAASLIIERGADFDSKDIESRDMLYSLILNGNIEMAEFLLQSGARVHTADSHGRTPLHVSAWIGNSAAARLLLKYGSRADPRDLDRRTPLMLALWRKHMDVAQLLLANRADPNAECSQGATALAIAAQEGNEEAVQLLLRHGGDPFHRDRSGRTVTEVAIRSGQNRIVSILESGGKLTSYDAEKSNRLEILPSRTLNSSGYVSNNEESFGSRCHSKNPRSKESPVVKNRTSSKISQFRPEESSQSSLSTRGSSDGFAQKIIARSLSRSDRQLQYSSHNLMKSPDSVSGLGMENFYLSNERRSRPCIATNPKVRKATGSISRRV